MIPLREQRATRANRPRRSCAVLGMLSLALLSACGLSVTYAADSPHQAHQRSPSDIVLFFGTEVPPKPVKRVGVIETDGGGLSTYAVGGNEVILASMKAKAAELGVDGILNIQCDIPGVSASDSFCTGVAFIYPDAQ